MTAANVADFRKVFDHELPTVDSLVLYGLVKRLAERIVANDPDDYRIAGVCECCGRLLHKVRKVVEECCFYLIFARGLNISECSRRATRQSVRWQEDLYEYGHEKSRGAKRRMPNWKESDPFGQSC
jgi:hypothetical protein